MTKLCIHNSIKNFKPCINKIYKHNEEKNVTHNGMDNKESRSGKDLENTIPLGFDGSTSASLPAEMHIANLQETFFLVVNDHDADRRARSDQ